ncbi:protein translocase subunit SecD [Thermogutta sp.]|uniref:protein translocase subunit SecD n=1 Tax=Thermogutta sp. TaxID=1962930 RepID=UPI00321FD434
MERRSARSRFGWILGIAAGLILTVALGGGNLPPGTSAVLAMETAASASQSASTGESAPPKSEVPAQSEKAPSQTAASSPTSGEKQQGAPSSVANASTQPQATGQAETVSSSSASPQDTTKASTAGTGSQPGQTSSQETKLARPTLLSRVLNIITYLVFLFIIFGIPVIAAYFLCEWWRAREYFGRISFILFTIVLAVVILLTRWPPKLGIDLSGGVIMVYEIEGAVRQPGTRTQAASDQIDMDQLIAALNRRVNPSGVKEVTIRRFGPQQIEIIVPEVDEEEVARLERVISSVGTLEFRILANMRDHRRLIERALALPPDENELYDDRGNLLAWWVPVAKGQEEAIGNYGEIAVRKGRYRNEDWLEVLVVKDRYNVTGADLFRVREGVDEQMQPCVEFILKAGSAQQRFGALTSDNRPDPTTGFTRRLGIILDGYLYSAPQIRSPIFDRGQITGIPSRDEVQALIQVLQAGSLPAVLSPTPISRLVTGPQLGRDTIRQSVIAMIVAAIIVFAFMIAYYRFAGVVACLAVILNLLMLVALMILLKAAFTLPGLAGLTLTVGMAVDANVLIYERIREELSRKATLRMAIRNGFEKAMSAIIDSNLTTILTAVILYFVGTDQVRGFAVTLFLGLVLNLYTAVFIARVIFEIGERRRWIKNLTMMQVIGATNFDFMGVKKYCIAGSLGLILLGLVALGVRGQGVLDIDFTGGVAVEILFNKPKDIAEVRNRLSELRDLAVSDVRIEGEEAGRRYMINTSSPPGTEAEEYLKQVKQKIAEVFGDELVHYRVEVEPITHTSFWRNMSGERLAAGPVSGWPSAIAGMLWGENAPAQEKPNTGNGPTIPAHETAPPQSAPATSSAPSQPTVPHAVGTNGERAGTPSETTKSSAQRFPTRVLLKFDHKLNYESLEELVKNILEKLPDPDRHADFELYNEKYRQGDTTAYNQWELRLALPPEKGVQVVQQIKAELEKTVYYPSSNTIGGKVAGSTRIRALYALVLSVAGMIIYLWVRFTRVSFGVAAAIALVHDVLITVGMIALSAYVANPLSFLLIDEFKIGLAVLAALLTIIGYSVNDTIIIFDRIREVKGKTPFLTPQIINTSVNQTLSRTLLTSLTTLFVIIVLYIGGGAGIHAFSFTLLVGVITGTYSSVFIASPILLWLSPRPTGPASQVRSLQYVS